VSFADYVVFSQLGTLKSLKVLGKFLFLCKISLHDIQNNYELDISNYVINMNLTVTRGKKGKNFVANEDV
jgi:hypothetical protein